MSSKSLLALAAVIAALSSATFASTEASAAPLNASRVVVAQASSAPNCNNGCDRFVENGCYLAMRPVWTANGKVLQCTKVCEQ
jgi:hypothetical protein